MRVTCTRNDCVSDWGRGGLLLINRSIRMNLVNTKRTGNQLLRPERASRERETKICSISPLKRKKSRGTQRSQKWIKKLFKRRREAMHYGRRGWGGGK